MGFWRNARKIAGGIGGGIAGFAAGGPMGAMAGAQAGSSLLGGKWKSDDDGQQGGPAGQAQALLMPWQGGEGNPMFQGFLQQYSNPKLDARYADTQNRDTSMEARQAWKDSGIGYNQGMADRAFYGTGQNQGRLALANFRQAQAAGGDLMNKAKYNAEQRKSSDLNSMLGLYSQQSAQASQAAQGMYQDNARLGLGYAQLDEQKRQHGVDRKDSWLNAGLGSLMEIGTSYMEGDFGKSNRSSNNYSTPSFGGTEYGMQYGAPQSGPYRSGGIGYGGPSTRSYDGGGVGLGHNNKLPKLWK